eukprot:12923714-Prorocentrum_lima.AAC.1
MAAYFRDLGLSEQECFDADGQAFHRGIIGLRVGPWIQHWLRGGELPRHPRTPSSTPCSSTKPTPDYGTPLKH